MEKNIDFGAQFAKIPEWPGHQIGWLYDGCEYLMAKHSIEMYLQGPKASRCTIYLVKIGRS